MPELTPRREQLMAAATRVVAEQGLRGLTHRAVDREAGVSEGSCSAYYRTRRALEAGLTAYVAGALAADVAALTEQLRSQDADPDRAVRLTTSLFQRWLQQREQLVTRLELSVAASRDAELADLLADWRRTVVGLVDTIVAAKGHDHSAERAEVLVAAFDGILLGAVSRPTRGRQAFLTRSVEQLMGSLGAPDHQLG